MNHVRPVVLVGSSSSVPEGQVKVALYIEFLTVSVEDKEFNANNLIFLDGPVISSNEDVSPML